MHRIDTKTAQKDKFGAGKNGFTRGNPQTGTPATDLDDDYFDMLQEELCSVVEASGASLEKGRHDQMLTALRALLLSRKNPFGDIKSDGTVQTALENLGLGEAAKRDVGTGENQIPDMVSFSGVRDFYGKQLLPGGLILQWLTIPSSAAVKAVTLDNGNYQLSGYKWPQSFGVLFAVFATKVSGSTNEAYAISVNRHSTDVIVTWNARKADDVHILGIGKL
ncbi:gp53-like domain-containing protein [Escherichia coli]